MKESMTKDDGTVVDLYKRVEILEEQIKAIMIFMTTPPPNPNSLTTCGLERTKLGKGFVPLYKVKYKDGDHYYAVGGTQNV